MGQAFEVCHRRTLSETAQENTEADKNNPGEACKYKLLLLILVAIKGSLHLHGK